MSHSVFSPASAIGRALIGGVGGFVAAIAFATGCAAALVATQWVSRAEAIVAAGMPAFLVWTIALLVSFGAPTVRHAALWVGGSIVGFGLLGWSCLAIGTIA